jgi:hypothetical protein
MMAKIIGFGTAILVGLVPGAMAVTLSLTATLAGHDERVDAPDPCLQEGFFLAGTASAEANLRVGGNSYGCDSEWAAGLQFDLSDFSTGQQIQSAQLMVRKTGYADDAAGFAIVGTYSYPASGGSVSVLRSGLTPETALDIVSPPAANVDMEFTVTSAVQDLIDDGIFDAGFLLCGVYSEVGYLNYITIGNTTGSNPPLLVIEFEEGTVPASSDGWGSVKSLFR